MIRRMNPHLIGQLCALLTAVLWAYAVVLFKVSGERVSPLALNLYKNTVGLVLLVITQVILIAAGFDRLDELFHPNATADLCLLMFSGLVGIAIADTIFFHALNLIGVGLISIVDCSYCLFAMLFAWLLLAETLTVYHYLGAALIVSGVFIASRHKLPVGRTRWQIVSGMLLASLAVALMAFGIVITKPVLEDYPLVWATLVRLTAGGAFLALFALLGRNWRRHWTVFRPATSWRTLLPASVVGTYVCLILWVAGFKYTHASVAAVLNQTTVVFASVFAAWILKEHFGVRKMAALVMAMIGVVIVTLSGWIEAHRPGLLAGLLGQ